MSFFGRRRELEVIEQVLDRAIGGRGWVVVLAGDPGIGKTRLAREASERASTRGMRVAWGRAWESGGAPPGWPVSEVLRALATPEILDKLGARVGHLRSIAPELAAGQAHARPIEDKSGRFSTYAAVRDLVEAAADRAPLLLVFDDVHAADAITIEIIHFLARSAASRPIVMLVTWRAHEARHTAPELLAAIAREATTLDVGPLVAEEAEALARHALGPRAAEGERHALLERCAGNPLFLEELARGGGRTFGGIEHAIRGHLDRLGPAARSTAEVAAVCGRTARVAVIARVGLDARDSIEEAVRCEVLSEAEGSVSFVHVLVRDALYESIDVGRRRALHAKVLDALEETGAAPSELAHHALRALPSITTDRALALARRAAHEARKTYAYGEAASILGQAIEHVLAEKVDRAAILPLELELAKDHILSGHVARGKEIAARVGDAAERSGDAEILARAALVYGTEFTVGRSDEMLRSLLSRARAALPATPSPLRARVTARFATALYPDDDDYETPIAYAHEGIEMARACGDPRTLFDVLYVGRLPLVFAMLAKDWLAQEEETLALSRVYGDDFELVRSLAMAFFGRLAVGDVTGARAALAECTALSARFPEPHARFRVFYLNAMEMSRCGRFAESERFVAEAEANAAAGPVSTALPMGKLYQFGQMFLRRDRAALREAGPLLESIARAPNYRLLKAATCSYLGDVDGTRAALDRSLQSLAGKPLALVNHVALAAITAGDRTRMEEAYACLLPRSDEVVLWGMVASNAEGVVASTLGKLAAAFGRIDEARERFERAIELDAQMEARPALAHDHADWAQILEPHDPNQAREHRARADGMYREIGLTHLIAETPIERVAVPSRALRSRAEVTADGDVFAITFEDRTVRVKDQKGTRYLARLVETPGRAVHVLELVASDAGTELAGSDAGPMIDKKARDAYRARLADLAEDLEEAERNADLGRASGVQREIDAVINELTRATGLGGRTRRAGSAAERARVNVQRRIKSTLSSIASLSGPVAEHLERAIRTGTFCSYDP